jgi:glycine betaine/proline transport system substrate-binding protein
MKTLKILACTAALAVGFATSAFAAEKTVRLAYVEWSDTVVATNIVKIALEKKGFTVETIPLPAAAMWEAVAKGEADAMVAAWLPTTHAAYFAKLKDEIVNLGPNVEGAQIGWAVPTYMTQSSIADFVGKEDAVGGQVIGIDPGAGLMRASEKAIKDYALKVNLVEGSDATMTAALKDAYSRKEPIIVTTWTPHWMFGRWDLKYLSDPKGSFGGKETVNTIVRKGLKEDLPEAYAILDNFGLSLEEEQKVMVANEDGGDPAKTAAAWAEANAAKVESWSK